ncbi:hypothetical protein [Nitrosomonas sp.]|uniref:hypothetical protein n=1 Tax=Nitrosomonas sp. TaxID=42353 RepID=UPI0025DEBD1A|nr:hypothetical protein [Nitrosomonas sp.]
MEFMSWTGGLVAQWLRIELAIPRGLATGIGAGHVEKIYFTGFVFRDSFNLELAIFTYPQTLRETFAKFNELSNSLQFLIFL